MDNDLQSSKYFVTIESQSFGFRYIQYGGLVFSGSVSLGAKHSSFCGLSASCGRLLVCQFETGAESVTRLQIVASLAGIGHEGHHERNLDR